MTFQQTTIKQEPLSTAQKKIIHDIYSEHYSCIFCANGKQNIDLGSGECRCVFLHNIITSGGPTEIVAMENAIRHLGIALAEWSLIFKRPGLYV